MKNLVFVHVHRTGGSSIWHNLVPIATASGWGICDIYHQSKLAFGIPVGAEDVLTSLRSRVGNKACLFHHHTAEPIRSWFDEPNTVYATVLRDPVDRYLSLVYHLTRFFRSPETPPEYAAYYAQLCGEEFCRCVAGPQVHIEELLEATASQPFFASYYTTLFRSLCQDNAELDPQAEISVSDAQSIAEDTRSMFAEIGWFSQLDMAFARIVQAYGIGDAGHSMQVAINRSPARRPLTWAERRRFERVLETEYAFVEQLGIHRMARLARSA